MTARALRFEDRERKTIALYALEFYKVGTIVFIHELNGTLSEKRWNPDIRRSKPLGTTGEFHSYPGNTKAASPNMPAICSGVPSSPCWRTRHSVPGMLLFCAGS